MARTKKPPVAVCEWVLDRDGEYYDTSCGKTFQTFDGGTPSENDMRFCAYCGLAIQTKDPR